MEHKRGMNHSTLKRGNSITCCFSHYSKKFSHWSALYYDHQYYLASPAKYEYVDNKNIAKQKQPEPEQKYDYAINTEIPRTNLGTQPNSNSGQPELNYDYAANTDIPRIPLNTKPKDELKYDYAINTEIPRINLNTQPKSDNAVDPATDQTYHTLEEPNTPAPYYSTLDNPAADETKSLVGEITHNYILPEFLDISNIKNCGRGTAGRLAT